jgi:hypothetical protein
LYSRFPFFQEHQAASPSRMTRMVIARLAAENNVALLVCSRPPTVAEMKAVFLATGPAADEPEPAGTLRPLSGRAGIPVSARPDGW